jgi:3-keto-5-aminohexanoate cleavage enzyme
MPEIKVWIEESLYATLGQEEMVFPVHLEPKIPDMSKKLIINVAPAGSLISRKQNPNQPYNIEEIAKEVIESYKAGAAMWHVHCRENGVSKIEPEIYKKTMDMVFPECPDIITNICMIFSFTREGLKDRLKPIIDPLIGYGQHYCESSLVNPLSMTTGYGIYVQTHPGSRVETAYLEEKGVKPELVGWNMHTLDAIKSHLVDTGVAKKPYLIDIIMGFPWRSARPYPTADGLTNLIQLVRHVQNLFPPYPDTVWQAIIAGHNWLPNMVAAITLGADIIRVGMEDSVHIYPHKDDLMKSNAEVVKKVFNIAKELGREIATPKEARKILGIKP